MPAPVIPWRVDAPHRSMQDRSAPKPARPEQDSEGRVRTEGPGTGSAFGGGVVRLTVALRTSARTAPEIADALLSMINGTRLEPGCLGCVLWTEEGRTTIVNYVEEWADEDAVRVRVQSDRFTRLLAVLEQATERPHVEFDLEGEILGLEYVAAVRDQYEERTH